MNEPVRAAPILLFFCPSNHPRVSIEERKHIIPSLLLCLLQSPPQHLLLLARFPPLLLISLPALSQDGTQFGTLCAYLSLSLTPKQGHAAEAVDTCQQGASADPRIEDHAETILRIGC